jgi:very-short-patch-repair endonuclease
MSAQSPLPFRGEGWERGSEMRVANLIQHAKSKRSEATEPEQRIWLALRAERFEGTKFRRQKVTGPYIVDFASRDPMLVREIDGDTHADHAGYDAGRTNFLEKQGYRVPRFNNTDVMSNLEGVLLTLAGDLAQAPLPTLSSEGERA